MADKSDSVHVKVRNTLRNPLHLNTGLDGVTHFDLDRGAETVVQVHRDQIPRLQRMGLKVEETSAPRREDPKVDFADVNRNVAAGIQASDKNTIDPAQRALVAAASGDPRDLQGVAHHHDELTNGQRLAQEASGTTEESRTGASETDMSLRNDSIPQLLAEVEAGTVPYGQLRSRAKAMLGDDFPMGTSPKKDELVELLQKKQAAQS